MLVEERGGRVGSSPLRLSVSCTLTSGLWLDKAVQTLANRLQHHSTSTSANVLGTLHGKEQNIRYLPLQRSSGANSEIHQKSSLLQKAIVREGPHEWRGLAWI